MPAEKQNKLVPLINPGHSGESWGYTVSKAMEFAKKGSFEKHPGYATVTQTLKTEKQFSSEATSDKSSDKSNKPSGGLIGSLKK